MSLSHKANREDVNIQFALKEKADAIRLQQLKEDLSRKEKFNVYTQRLVGELMEFMIRNKQMTSQQAFIITSRAKSAVFTKEELYELQKISNKQMQEAHQ